VEMDLLVMSTSLPKMQGFKDVETVVAQGI
jgi:hypothetical protein